MSTEAKRERMLSMVEDWKASGLTQKAFSALHGIKVATFGYWVARSKELDGGDFILLTSGSARRSEPIEIIYPTGVRLKVPRDLSPRLAITNNKHLLNECRIRHSFFLMGLIYFLVRFL